ncbi:MAG: sulfatase [Candidatus Nanohaloarchaea archaeon]
MEKETVATIALVFIAVTAASTLSGNKTVNRPNVVLITLEATEASKLVCYSYHRNTTPNLCDLAESSTVYTNAYTASTYTPLAISSISTGRYPFEIGMYTGDSVLRQRFSTLAERLSSAGYVTYGLHAGNPQLLPPEKGILQGFERFSANGSSIAHLLESSDRPVFVREHINGPHYPYRTGEAYEPRYIDTLKENWLELVERSSDREPVNRTVERYIEAAYDDNLRATDIHEIGPMLERLRESPEFNNTFVIVTADHGHTELGSYGPLEHRHRQLHVPLIIHYPGKEQGRDSSLVSTIDIMPTVLDAAGLDYSRETVRMSTSSPPTYPTGR